MNTSVFKSPEARDEFREHYRNVLARFPFGQQYVNTSFGQTFMLTAGKEIDPPVLLLHGSCSNSAFWFPEILTLSENYRVYAIDIIGEAGNSEEYRPDLLSGDFAEWMKEVADALGLKKSIIIGNSLGGWMALNFATNYPERVSRLGLLASAGLAEVRPQFISNVEKAGADEEGAQVGKDIIGENSIPKEILDFMNLIVRSYNPIQHLPVYEDAALKKLDMPVLFVDGKDDVIIDAEESAKRLSALVPSAEVHLIDNCGHVLLNSIEYVLPFLMKGN